MQSGGNRAAGVFAMHAVLIGRTLPSSALFLAMLIVCPDPLYSARVSSLDPIATIVDAFRTHAIVAIDDNHGELRCSDFRLALVRDRRFADAANDIVVEFGNSRYQSVIDDFISGGAVSDDRLRAVWQDTTIPRPVWDRPIYEEFLRTVREVNVGRRRDRQLRVVLGDPPIDWSTIRTAADLAASSRGRSSFPAEIIAREVVAKKRRALVIYGGLHLMRQNLQGANLIERVETRAPGSAFVAVTHPLANVSTLGIDSRSLKAPTLLLTAGSSLANQVDAVLYLGEPGDRQMSRLPPRLCADTTYRAMRVSRMTIAGDDKAREHLDEACTAQK